ncbi:MAG: LysE family transporter [Candidatus Bathyarchaeia archaeon]
MEFITDFYLFLTSVVLISLSGVMLPGPMFAVTIEKAAKRKTAGIFIAAGHGIIELPLMFVIYYWLSQFDLPSSVPIVIGLLGGSMMTYMGIQTFRNRKNQSEQYQTSKHEALTAGLWTTAINAGFYLWWLAIGLPLIINAQIFGLIGFSTFAVVHWLCDFIWYTSVAFIIFKSRRFWTKKTHQAIIIFCAAVFVGFGLWFLSSAAWSAISAFIMRGQ